MGNVKEDDTNIYHTDTLFYLSIFAFNIFNEQSERIVITSVQLELINHLHFPKVSYQQKYYQTRKSTLIKSARLGGSPNPIRTSDEHFLVSRTHRHIHDHAQFYYDRIYFRITTVLAGKLCALKQIFVGHIMKI